MKTQTFQMHLYWSTLAEEYELWRTDSIASKYTLYVGPVTMEAQVPESFDVRSAQLNQVNKEMTTLRAEFQQRLTELQRQANELMAIEMEPA